MSDAPNYRNENYQGSSNTDGATQLLIEFIVDIQLKDIFARGFICDDKFKFLLRQTYAVNYYNLPSILKKVSIGNIYSLYNLCRSVILGGWSDAITYSSNNKYKDFLIVFNEKLQSPSKEDYPKYFIELSNTQIKHDKLKYKEEHVIRVQEQGYYKAIKPFAERFINASRLLDNYASISIKPLLQLKKESVVKHTEGAFKKLMDMFKQTFKKSGVDDLLIIPHDAVLKFEQGSIEPIQKYFEEVKSQLCMATRMPATKLFGSSAEGFNATGKGDQMNYEQTLDEMANSLIIPILESIADIMDSLNLLKQKDVTFISGYKLSLVTQVVDSLGAYQDNSLVKQTMNAYLKGITGFDVQDVVAEDNTVSTTDGEVVEDTESDIEV